MKIVLLAKKYQFFIIIFCLMILSVFFWWHYFTPVQLANDAAQYEEAARNLLQNHSFIIDGHLSMMREPGYPFFIFLIYKIFGVSWLAVKIAQFFLHFSIVLMVYFLARRFFNEFCAKSTAAIVALYPIFNIYSGLLLSEILAGWLAMVFLTLFLLAQDKQKYYLYAAAGLSLGFLSMVKFAFLPLAGVAVLFIFFDKIKVNWRLNFKKVLIFSFCVLAPIAPWLARNYVAFGQLSLSSRSGTVLLIRASKSLYSGSTIKKYLISSLSGEYMVRRFIDPAYNFENDYINKNILNEYIAQAEEKLKTDNYDQIDASLRAEALKLIKTQPVKYFLFGFSELNNLNSPMIYYEKHFSIFHDNIYDQTLLKVTAILALRAGWLVFLAAVIYGIFVVVKRKIRAAYMAVLVILSVNFITFFLQGNPRFLMPIFPLYLMLAIFGCLVVIKKMTMNR